MCEYENEYTIYMQFVAVFEVFAVIGNQFNGQI